MKVTAKPVARKSNLQRLNSGSDFNSPRALASITALVLVGSFVVIRLFAANQTTLEAESGTRVGGAITDDSSASSGKYLKFVAPTTTPPPPPPVVTPPPPPPPVQPPPPPPPASIPGTAIFLENFEGRGQSIVTGTLINTINGFTHNYSSSVPAVGWYPYGQQQSDFVLPQFDSSKKVAGTYSGRFGIRNQGSADNQDYTGGSYYMYRDDSAPSRKLYANFWWQFDAGMSGGGGNCALYSAWTTAANDLTYLRFYGGGGSQGVIRWQEASGFTTSAATATLQAGTWYKLETVMDTDSDTSSLTIKNTSGTVISQISYQMEASDSIRMFEFGALTARPYSAFPSAPGGGAYWYDDFQLNRS